MAESRKRDQRLGLGSLAFELQELICHNLWQPGSDGLISNDSQTALLNLSGCSRVLRDIAQPLAYHTLTHGFINLGKLVRTLHERRDLASCLRTFHEPLRGTCTNNAAQKNFLRSVADEFQLWYEGHDQMRFRRSKDSDLVLEDVCIELIIILSCNLQTLKVYSPNNGVDQRKDQYPLLYKHFRNISPSTIRHLELGRKSTVDMPYTRPSIDTALMFHGTQNMRQLIIRGVSDLQSSLYGQESFERMIASSTLKRLRLMELQECALDTRDWGEMFLGQLVWMAPNLENLRYISQHYRNPEPVAIHLSVPQMLRAIRTSDSIISLKSLDICLCAFVRCEWPNRGNLISASDLEEFKSLETLKLDENAVCGYYDSPLDPDLSSPVTSCLTEVLPRRLRQVVIRVYKGSGSHIWGDLAELAVRSFQFPDLGSVLVQAISKAEKDYKWSLFEEQVLKERKLLKGIWLETKVKFEIEVYRTALPDKEHGVLGVIS
ncbi:hypothetical protein FZEAL_8866 [Fusarium zealandicum]|uniref:Uncharacterized protein n=1 Tax=Fusarium zealandicum TaxID=1053134 RepID=A0A8H4XGE2_9HYPO|nr:hypothetical protein FZEAL_8866 [Fusarium zealandicum]